MDNSAGTLTVEWAQAASEGLARRVLQFTQLLRSAGLAVTSGRVIDAQRSLNYLDLGRRDDVYHALRANLIARPEDRAVFDALFNTFWGGMDALESNRDELGQPDSVGSDDARRAEEAASPPRRSERRRETRPDEDDREKDAGYSAIEVPARKDFSALDAGELEEMQGIMARLAPKLWTARSRRFRPGSSGSQLDFPRTLRQSLHTGGDVIDLSWRKRRVDTARLVLLCDVSRSMETYSRFLIQFMYAFQNELPRTETFVFSTRLMSLTNALRGRQLDDALERATIASAGWSSGTRIGECLEEFNRGDTPRPLDRRTVVVILSDGWDGGNPELLREQIALIKRRSRLVVWLNPLLEDPRYRPLVAGMRAALPHIDLFLPCHNLASLEAFAVELSRR